MDNISKRWQLRSSVCGDVLLHNHRWYIRPKGDSNILQLRMCTRYAAGCKGTQARNQKPDIEFVWPKCLVQIYNYHTQEHMYTCKGDWEGHSHTLLPATLEVTPSEWVAVLMADLGHVLGSLLVLQMDTLLQTRDEIISIALKHASRCACHLAEKQRPFKTWRKQVQCSLASPTATVISTYIYSSKLNDQTLPLV